MTEKEEPLEPEIIVDQEEIYPPKPLLPDPKSTLNKSIMSMVLYVVAFYVIFDWEITDILVLVGIVFIHELGHFLAMKAFNYKNLGIFFLPLLGAYAKGEKEQISQRQEVIVLLAGPIPGIVIGTVLYFMTRELGDPVLSKTALFFIYINAFNLLPVLPLDGGRVVNSLFFAANHIVSGIFVGISIVATAYFAISTESWVFLMVPFFLGINIYSRLAMKKLRTTISQTGTALDKTYDELSDEEYWVLRDYIGTHIQTFKKIITPGQHEVSQHETKVIKYIKGMLHKPPTKDITTGGKVLVVLIWLAGICAPLGIVMIHYGLLRL